MSTFIKDRLEDSCGQFNIIKNIKNLSLVILDDTVSSIPSEYKDFKFIPGKRLILSENDTKEEKVSYPKGSFIERLESVKVKNVLNELPKSSKDKDDLSTEFVFTIDSRKHLINENSIIQISEVNHDKNGNILIEIEFQKVSGPSLYHTEYAVFELHHLNYNKFILELTKDKR